MSVKLKKLLIFPAVFFLLSGAVFLLWHHNASGGAVANNRSLVRQSRAENPYNRQLSDSCIRLLQTGDLVLRMGADVTSYMFSRMNQKEKIFSHCGLVVVEDGYPFVYHSIGGEDNPDAELRRDSANFWFSPANNLSFGIARFAWRPEQMERLLQVIYLFYAQKRKFDMKFDLRTDDRLYCAEFVYKAVNQAMEDPEFIKPSAVFGYQFVGVDNLYLNRHADFICRVQYK